MSAHTFRATCRKAVLVYGNGKRVQVARESVDNGVYKGALSVETCDEVFEGAEGAVALKAHMKAHHGPRPSFTEPKPLKPYAWKAPRPSKDGIDGVLAKIAAGDYNLDGFDVMAEAVVEEADAA